MEKQNSTILDVLQQQFNNLEAQMNGSTNSDAHLARKSAFDLYKEAGFPSRRDEEYKYTPLGKHLEKDFADFLANPVIDELKVDKNALPELNGCTIVFVNGHYNEELSHVAEKSGVKVQISTSQQEIISNSTSAYKSSDVFSGLNLALASSGTKISVAKGVIIEDSINIFHITCTKEGKVMTTPRHEISIGENAQATVTEIFLGSGDNPSFTNSAMEVSIGPQAIFNHYKVGLDTNADLRIDNTNCRQERNSVLNTVNVNFGGKLVRNNLNISLEGEHCETNLDGLYIPTENGSIDNHTVVDHKLPNSNSNELYKGIMGEHATGVFNGKVFVREDAQKTNAFQSNKNILLADTATINTKPQLEIWADDVKCTHGCTTGQMDKEQLFYLRARGIDKENAQRLLLKAFAEEVIEKIKDDTLRARVSAILDDNLNR